MAIGYLLIQARTAHDALPLSGAQIWVLDGQEKSIYHLITDESGETKKVSLETLDRSLSLDPNYQGTPYISYHVLAFANGFNTVHIDGIPILEGETAIQPIEFVPMRQSQRVPEVTEIQIGPPSPCPAGVIRRCPIRIRRYSARWSSQIPSRCILELPAALHPMSGYPSPIM